VTLGRLIAMGLITDTKATSASKDASRAASEGRQVFVYRYNVPATSSGYSGPIGGASEVIEGIERHNWTLCHMAYDGAQSKNGAVLLLFRRR
jgi:hypothetical protein